MLQVQSDKPEFQDTQVTIIIQSLKTGRVVFATLPVMFNKYLIAHIFNFQPNSLHQLQLNFHRPSVTHALIHRCQFDQEMKFEQKHEHFHLSYLPNDQNFAFMKYKIKPPQIYINTNKIVNCHTAFIEVDKKCIIPLNETGVFSVPPTSKMWIQQYYMFQDQILRLHNVEILDQVQPLEMKLKDDELQLIYATMSSFKAMCKLPLTTVEQHQFMSPPKLLTHFLHKTDNFDEEDLVVQELKRLCLSNGIFQRINTRQEHGYFSMEIGDETHFHEVKFMPVIEQQNLMSDIMCKVIHVDPNSIEKCPVRQDHLLIHKDLGEAKEKMKEKNKKQADVNLLLNLKKRKEEEAAEEAKLFKEKQKKLEEQQRDLDKYKREEERLLEQEKKEELRREQEAMKALVHQEKSKSQKAKQEEKPSKVKAQSVKKPEQSYKDLVKNSKAVHVIEKLEEKPKHKKESKPKASYAQAVSPPAEQNDLELPKFANLLKDAAKVKQQSQMAAGVKDIKAVKPLEKISPSLPLESENFGDFHFNKPPKLFEYNVPLDKQIENFHIEKHEQKKLLNFQLQVQSACEKEIQELRVEVTHETNELKDLIKQSAQRIKHINSQIHHNKKKSMLYSVQSEFGRRHSALLRDCEYLPENDRSIKRKNISECNEAQLYYSIALFDMEMEKQQDRHAQSAFPMEISNDENVDGEADLLTKLINRSKERCQQTEVK